MNLRCVIKRPAVCAGKRPPIVFLFSLLCALLLLLSGCGSKRGLAPPPDDETSTTGSSETLTTAGGGEIEEVIGGGGTAESSAHVLTRGELSSKLRKNLESLSKRVTDASKELERLESKTAEETVLSNILSIAETWLTELKNQTTESQDIFKTYYDVDTLAPGLPKFSERLELMLEVVHNSQSRDSSKTSNVLETSQDALAKLRDWLNELTIRVDALPALLPSDAVPDHNTVPVPDTTPAAENEALTDMSNRLGGLSKKVDTISGTVNNILQDLQNLSKAPSSVSIGIWGILFFAVSAANFLLFLYLLIFGPFSQKENKSQTKSRANPSAQGNPIYDVKAAVNAISDKVDSLSERIDNMPALFQNARKVADVPPLLAKNSQPSPSLEYFKVTSPNVADGQLVYLQKRSLRSELCGRPLSNDPQIYRISPVMSNTTDNGKRGIVGSNVLYTGDIIAIQKISNNIQPCETSPYNLLV